MFSYPVFLLAKLIQRLLKKFGRGGGTALPGLVAERLHKGLMRTLANQLDGSIWVVGTNGKTTTSRLIASYLEGDNRTIVHNRSGSNLTRGILSALIESADWRGHIGQSWGLFEVDEAVLPKLLSSQQPDYLVALNLFRDQLDRYGEVDAVAAKWRSAGEHLTARTTLVLNADDPLIASLGVNTRAHVVYFGTDYRTADGLPQYADTRYCPLCGQALQFTGVSYSHLGSYRCRNKDFSRPTVQFEASQVELRGMTGSSFVLKAISETPIALELAGAYNVYNATAALALAAQLKLPPAMLIARTGHFEAVFGRLEKVELEDMSLTLILVKNPTGFNQVLQTLATDKTANNFWLLLNDKFADGRDVSWIWDVELELLAAQASSVVVSGTRAADMALRVKYAGYAISEADVFSGMSDGLRHVRASDRRQVYCLCTYTAMLELRQLLQTYHAVDSYHRG